MKPDLLENGEKLQVMCTGRCSQSDLLEVVDTIAEARTRNPRLRKCIIDALNADWRLSGMGEFFVGEYAAKRLSGMRISLLVGKGQATTLLENAAYNRGLKLLLTSDREDAEGWLSE